MYAAALRIRHFLILGLAAIVFGNAHAAAGNDLDQAATAALNKLYAEAPATKALGEKAKAVLVFPEVYKAALLVGGQGGRGAMLKDGKIVGYYSIGGVAVGLEAGAQTYSYAVFLMTDEAVARLKGAAGLELGVEPNIVVLNAGAGANVSTATTPSDVYAYVFGTQGLMGGVSLQGLKITKQSS